MSFADFTRARWRLLAGRLFVLPLAGLMLGAVLGSGLVGALAQAGVLEPFTEGPTGFTAAITVNNTTNTQLRYSSAATHLWGKCTVETAGLNVFLVNAADSGTTAGEGPYCDTCSNGVSFVIAGRDYARTSAGSGTVRCRFYDAGIGGVSMGGGGGGLSQAVADDRYVNETGDTMTGALVMDTAGGANASLSETGIDRASASAQTFDVGNSSGAMSLTVDGAGVCLLPGNGLCNATGTFNFDNLNGNCDIASASGDQLELCSVGAAALALRSGSDSVYFESSGGGERMAAYVANNNSYRGGMYMIDGGSGLSFTGGLGYERYQGTTIGVRSISGWTDPDDRVAGFAKALSSDGTFTDIHAWYASGLHSVRAVQTCDCGTTGTPNAVTCDVQSDVILLTDGDADDCTVTLATTTIDAIVATGGNVDLPEVMIYVDSVGGGGDFDINDQAGIVDVRAQWSGVVRDSLSLRYSAVTADAFEELGRVGGSRTSLPRLIIEANGTAAAPAIELANGQGITASSGGVVSVATNSVIITDTTTAGLQPGADVTFNLGASGREWSTIYVSNLISVAGPLTIADTVTEFTQATAGNMPSNLLLPGLRSTSTATKPTCTLVAHGGRVAYIDDLGDGKPAEVCVCVGSADDTAATWVNMINGSGCSV